MDKDIKRLLSLRANPHFQLSASELKKIEEWEKAQKKVEIKEATVNNVNDIQQAARSLLGKVQAIYVPTDNVLASAMPALAMVTEEAKLPVIAGEGGMVKSGGVATLALDYYKLGKQSGEMAADILSGKAKPQDMPIQSQKEFTITINEENAKKIGLTIPKEILDKAVK